MPIDYVVSLEGHNFASYGSNINMENTFLSSDGHIVRLPKKFEEFTLLDEYTKAATKNSYRPGLINFIANEILDVFSSFTENITDLDFLLETVRFMFCVLTICIVFIHIIITIFLYEY